MLIYLGFLSVPLFASIFSPARQKWARLALLLYFVPLLIFTGLRDGIGPDWSGYEYLYDISLSQELSDALHNNEPSFFLLNKASEALGWGLHGVMLVCSAIFLLGVFSYALRTRYPWVALAVVMPYLVFIISMSGIRQAAAIGIGFFMLSRWDSTSTLTKVALIAAAMSFHNSAAFFLFFVILAGRTRVGLRLIVAAAVMAFLVFGLQTEVHEKYRTVYFEENVVSGGALLHVLLSACPAALYLILRRKISSAVGPNYTVAIGSVMALAALPLVFVSSTGADRLALYLSFVQMWVYPGLIVAHARHAIFWKLLIVCLSLTVFFVYFLYGTYADAYVPYQSVFD